MAEVRVYCEDCEKHVYWRQVVPYNAEEKPEGHEDHEVRDFVVDEGVT